MSKQDDGTNTSGTAWTKEQLDKTADADDEWVTLRVSKQYVVHGSAMTILWVFLTIPRKK